MEKMVICSKYNIKGVMDENEVNFVENLDLREFSGQNDDNNRDIKDSVTIAPYIGDFSWDVFKPWIMRIRKG